VSGKFGLAFYNTKKFRPTVESLEKRISSSFGGFQMDAKIQTASDAGAIWRTAKISKRAKD
jgi:hypothetical protein